jgi:hypothetical protein
MHFSIGIGSLYPIDITGALAATVQFPQSTLSIGINTQIQLEGSIHRSFIHKAALPRLKWSYCSDGVWRQHHAPLDHLVGAQLINALRENIDETASAFGRNPDIARRVVSNGESLIGMISENIPRDASWVDLTHKILEKFYRDVCGRTPTFFDFTPIRNGEQNDFNSAIISLLSKEIEGRKDILSFDKGGYIEVLDRARGQWRRFRKVKSVDNDALLLLDEDIPKNRDVSNRSIRVELGSANNLRIRLGGPTELLQLLARGHL